MKSIVSFYKKENSETSFYFCFFLANKSHSELIENITKDLEDKISPDRLIFLSTQKSTVDFMHIKNILEESSIITGTTCFQEITYDLQKKEIKITNLISREETIISTEDFIKIISPSLCHIFSNEKLIIEASDGYHFAKPSGTHSDKFIRASNILEKASSRYFIATAAIILGLDLASSDYIYCDTSGITSLIYTIKQITPTKPNNNFYVNSFGSYFGIKDNTFPVSGENPSIVISASTSQKLQNKLHQTNKNTKIFTLFFLGEEKDPAAIFDIKKIYAAADLHIDTITSESESDCEYCKTYHSTPLRLTSDQFTIEHPKSLIHRITKDYATSELHKFIETIANTGAIRMFYDGLGNFQLSKRFFIDVKTLISSPQFQEIVKNCAIRNFPIHTSHVFYCKDTGAKELADFIVTSICPNGTNIIIDSISTIEKYDKKDISGVVIISAASESGRSMLNVSRQLRKFGDKPISYINGVSKYSCDEYLDRIKSDLEYSNGKYGRHSFTTALKIKLPVMEAPQNSWQEEVDFLSAISSPSKTVKSFIKSRKETLSSKANNHGLENEIFIPRDKSTPLFLNPNFAFWPAKQNSTECKNQAIVYFTIANILQRMRTGKNKAHDDAPLKQGYIINRIDPLCFDRFNDGLIQACILRAASKEELNYRDDIASSNLIADLINDLCNDTTSAQNAFKEFLLALCTKRLTLSNLSLIELVAKIRESKSLADDFEKYLVNHIDDHIIKSTPTPPPNF